MHTSESEHLLGLKKWYPVRTPESICKNTIPPMLIASNRTVDFFPGLRLDSSDRCLCRDLVRRCVHYLSRRLDQRPRCGCTRHYRLALLQGRYFAGQANSPDPHGDQSHRGHALSDKYLAERQWSDSDGLKHERSRSVFAYWRSIDRRIRMARRPDGAYLSRGWRRP